MRKKTIREEITEDDVADAAYDVRPNFTGKYSERSTLLDRQLLKMRRIIRKYISRPIYSKDTEQHIKELVNDLNRLQSAMWKHNKKWK